MIKAKDSQAEKGQFYDQNKSFYKSIGGLEGNLRWGYFDDLDNTSSADFLPACQRWNEYMLQRINVNGKAKILDVGCGDGSTAIWLAQQTGSVVVGIDISQVEIDNARQKAQEHPTLNLSFQQASVANLPFADGEFTHVWSQGNLYRVRDRAKALQEIYRVLKETGVFIFDDLVAPVSEFSETARNQVYERLSFEPTFSRKNYAEVFSQLGLMVLEDIDLSPHLHRSYQLLAQLALPDHSDLNKAYSQIAQAVERQELGWSFYLCHKISDRLTWIHDNEDTQELQSKYDAWAKLYETDIGKSWQIMPRNAAGILKELLPREDLAILDAGAGSGMVGSALAEQGYNNITAIDLSTEMLEIARTKQVYQALLQVNLENPITAFEQDAFEAILAIGVFTYGHASPTGLYHLLPLLRQGGIFILTVRLSNKPMQDAFTKLPWTLISQQEYLFEGAPFHILAYRKN